MEAEPRIQQSVQDIPDTVERVELPFSVSAGFSTPGLFSKFILEMVAEREEPLDSG